MAVLSMAALSAWSLEAPASPPPSAADIEEARSLAKEGYESFKQGDHARAVELLERAYALYQAPTVALLQARSLVKLGKLVEAARTYELAAGADLDAAASQPMRDAKSAAKSELAELLPRIPTLSIGLIGEQEGVSVRLNGEVVPEAALGSETLVNPGVYLINAIKEGKSVATERVALEEGASKAVMLRLAGSGDASSGRADGRGTTQRVVGWTSLGVGAVGIAVGVGAGVHMLNQKAILDAACLNGSCPRSAEGDLSSFRAARVASMIGYGAGMVGLGAGLTLLLLAPSGQPGASGAATTTKAATKSRATSSAAIERARVTPFIGLGSVGVMGAF
jgi:hypothetical protein